MKKIIQVIRFIVNHPLASKRKVFFMARFFKWQVSQSVFPYPVLYTFVENSLLIIKKGMTGATGNIYTGLHDFNDMGFVLHALRKEDIFGDIGANVGVYSILASVNAGARSIAAEPVPGTFANLIGNIRINRAEDKIRAVQVGIGDRAGELLFTCSGLDTINHVATEEEKTANIPTVKVPVKTADSLFENDCPAVIKIDVEGFEWSVLQGAANTIGNHDLKAVIIEINGSGGRYGIPDQDIHAFFVGNGFEPCTYDPFSRAINILSNHGPYNTIYIRDIGWAKQRVASSVKYQILGMEI